MPQFFKLAHPRYEDDFESERANPAWSTSFCNFPALICPVCGIVSDSLSRLRIPLPSEDIRLELKAAAAIPLANWFDEVSTWAKRLNVDPARIKPGIEIGPPSADLNGMPSNDFLFLCLEQWVRSRVMEKLLSIGCKGLEFSKAEFIYRGHGHEPVAFCDGCYADYAPIDLERLPEYWELGIRGAAWRVGQNETTIQVCKLCGEIKYADLGLVAIDESRWDGSDFFRIEERGWVFVTERVRDALEEIGATNYVCEPLPLDL